MAARRKQVAIKVEGMGALLKDLRYLPKDLGDEVRKASYAIGEEICRDARGGGVTSQAAPLLDSLKARNYRIPEVVFGGNARAGVSGGAKLTELMGANFGTSGRYPQFPAKRDPDIYVWRTIKSRARWITDTWMDAVGNALAKVDPDARR